MNAVKVHFKSLASEASLAYRLELIWSAHADEMHHDPKIGQLYTCKILQSLCKEVSLPVASISET